MRTLDKKYFHKNVNDKEGKVQREKERKSRVAKQIRKSIIIVAGGVREGRGKTNCSALTPTRILLTGTLERHPWCQLFVRLAED